MARKTTKTKPDRKAASSPTKGTKAKIASQPEGTVPVVGLGASAGGLQAYSAFFDATPVDTGAAFVLVHHLDPDHKSLMAQLLGKHTDMTVVPAEDQTTVQPNHVYVIPPNKYLEITDGVLHLSETTDRRGTRLPIDKFLGSLARDLGQNAVAVILSGTGSDGSAAVREIKEKGGVVLAQDPTEAAHDGMPRSAIATGAVDHVVPAGQMPNIIVKYLRHPFIQNGTPKKVLGENAKASLEEIITALRSHSPINFDLYKDGTLLRRIERRMALRHMEDSGDYLALLKDSDEEAQKLCADLLISVTSFFRDKEAYNYLDKTVLEDLVKSLDPKRPLRIWVPGCATGEEAYSLAMLVIEKINALRKDIKLQIFASDVDERALQIARIGIYPDSIAENVSPARLKRFFIKEDHSYRVTPELRDTVVFANQNVLADAPFSKLDLISCRNLMIYLTPEAQERIIRMFHFALNEGGTLFLGMSETTGSHEALFQPVSKKYRIYKRVGSARGRAFDFPITQRPTANASISMTPTTNHFRAPANKLAELSQTVLIEKYAPASVLINAQSEALYFEGPTDQYLRLPSGETSRDLLAMARQGLRARLSSVIRAARQGQTDVKETAVITRGGEKVGVTIQAHPVTLDRTELFLVTFTDEPTTPDALLANAPHDDATRQLEQELETTRTDLRNTISDYERSTEELKAVNEEAMSMNEEFQSTNEELETSKEELQSLNEELTTLNTQLQQKIEDERRVSDDLNNLLSSSGVATLFLDIDFKIMRFTPATRELFNLISKDIGRPFGDITGKLQDPDLLKDAQTVLETLSSTECEVSSDSGRWFIRRILPYRTQSGKIDGVVITFVEITDLKAQQKQTSEARKFAENVINTLREPLVVLDSNLMILLVSKSFHRVFETKKTDLIGKSVFAIQDGQWDVPELRELLEALLPQEKTIESFELTLQSGSHGRRDMVLNARKIENSPSGQELILLAVEDITEQNKVLWAVADREARLSAILDAVPEAIITIDEGGLISNFSPSAERIFGYTAEELIGENVNILMPEPDRAKHDGYLENYLKTGQKKIIGIGREMDAAHKDGSRVPIRLNVSELELDKKRHFLGILLDMTLDRQRQIELQRAQKMEAIGQLTGGLAHDFNNLLTVVIGNLELLDGRTDDMKLRELISEALEASNLGAALTSKLLSFSRSQSLTPESVALNDLVKVMLPLLKRTLGEHIQIEAKLTDDLDTTLADPGQIESALLNLAINARDAMPDGGSLAIETRKLTLDDTYAATQVDVTPGDYVCLSVSDTGVGIAPEIKSELFDPFFTTKGPGEGSGLGLSMVYGFAKQSGGHVTIEGEIGKGTSVNLYLPITNAKTGKTGQKKLGDIAAGAGEKILVVEDDPMVLRLTLTRLIELGYDVVAATTGPKAIDVIKRQQEIDLMISDVVMPGGMTGFDVAEQARTLRPDLKILLVTGHEKGASPQETGANSKYRVLRKPYALKELAQTLRDMLNRDPQ